MSRGFAVMLLGLSAPFVAPAAAQDRVAAAGADGAAADAGVRRDDSRHAVGTDFFVSTDADDTDVYRAGINFDVSYRNPDQYWGVRYEKAWYKPLGQKTTDRDRGYLLYADKSGHWAWNTQVGTDGHTVIGSASIHNDARIRQEYFVERDVLETPRGLGEGIYYTFLGGAVDLPIDDRNNLTLVAGAQEFTGKNVRLHLRGTYTHVLKRDWGLSVQLRTRYFHSTHPGEFDYYSPRWYTQVLPTLQLRRYSGGWRYMVAGGLGAQRDANSDWLQSRFVAAEVSSPTFGRDWFIKASAQYSNTPLRTGIYDYAQLSIALTRAF